LSDLKRGMGISVKAKNEWRGDTRSYNSSQLPHFLVFFRFFIKSSP